MLRAPFVLMLAFLGTLAIGCRTAPIRNPPPTVANPDLEITRGAIHHAIDLAGWNVASEEPGEILAQYNVRTHMIQVQITYDPKKVQLEYADSRNMKHSGSGSKGTIHKQYNVWVKQLMEQIKVALSSQKRYPVSPLPGQAPPTPAGTQQQASGAPAPPPPVSEEPASSAAGPKPVPPDGPKPVAPEPAQPADGPKPVPPQQGGADAPKPVPPAR